MMRTIAVTCVLGFVAHADNSADSWTNDQDEGLRRYRSAWSDALDEIAEEDQKTYQSHVSHKMGAKTDDVAEASNDESSAESVSSDSQSYASDVNPTAVGEWVARPGRRNNRRMGAKGISDDGAWPEPHFPLEQTLDSLQSNVDGWLRASSNSRSSQKKIRGPGRQKNMLTSASSANSFGFGLLSPNLASRDSSSVFTLAVVVGLLTGSGVTFALVRSQRSASDMGEELCLA